jgi:hypothetical protein
MDVSQLLRALGLEQAYGAYQRNIGEPFAAMVGGAGRGYLGLDKPEYGGLLAEESYRTGQALGNMPGIGAPAGAFKAAAQIPGLLEAAGTIPAIFIGPKSRLWNKTSAETFETLEKSGVSNKDAYLQTGTFRSPDGMLRQEISDFSSEYRPGKELGRLTEKYVEQLDEALAANYLRQTMDRLGIGIGDAKEQFRQFYGKEPPARSGLLAKSMTADETEEMFRKFEQRTPPTSNEWQSVVGNVFEHPELYKSYPEFISTKFYVKKPEDMPPGVGGYYDGNVVISNDIANAMQSGKSVMAHELQHGVQTIEGFGTGGMPENDLNRYLRLAGEAEARAVQARIGIPKEELRRMFPLESYDVPIDQLIIRGLLTQ